MKSLEPTPEPIDIVGVSFLNAKPLVAGLEAGVAAPFPYRYRGLPPVECACELGAGRAAAALLPVGALATSPQSRLVPSLGIACRGAVRSVLLISKVEPARIVRLAAHSASGTSIALAQTLLVERWGVRPEVVTCTPPLESMLQLADAAVLIGDPALAIHGRTGLLEIDLGQAWFELTSLPFVFALWGLAESAPVGCVGLLEASWRYGCQQRKNLIPSWSRTHGFEPEVVSDYLDNCLRYCLDDAEHRGISAFLDRTARLGILPPLVPRWLALDNGMRACETAEW
jgi:chorismate dehydratase